ncbi:MAG: serine/threonine protein phosphatase [Gammaproteobacteria bacterium RIFCSPHIGHO2_12_FULL_42_13]|nr:MAG: serine/threonine protein phosphatase [Gammaproteobacteria bacterium RIFCSPHIGHO2_12_FULL_42_13]
MKLVWLTDIHINFLDKDERILFYQKIMRKKCNALLISGDIAEGSNIIDLLTEMADAIQKPIYFVLGNHDYYFSSVANVIKDITRLTKTHSGLYWLNISGIQMLNENTILLGQDGWADGRLGDYQNSQVVLNDSRLIAELFQQKILGKNKLLQKMQSLADSDAKNLKSDLLKAITSKPKKIIILTHVPPFKEACLYQGKISGDDWLPFFGSKATGDVLLEIAGQNLDVEFLVLCGHTHGKACYSPLHNLMVKAGGAEYYQPKIQEVIEI